MLTKVIATGAGALIAGVAAYQITNTYMGDCGSSCSSDSKTAEVLAVAETGDSCCPLTGSKGAEILAVADTEGCATACETECTDEQKAACAAEKDCGTDSVAVVLAASVEEGACSAAEKAACSADKMACSTEGDSNTVEILMVAGEEACSTDKAACDSAKTECETKAACETEQLAAAASPADNG